jgi:ATP-binding cassette subfamily F protein uup
LENGQKLSAESLLERFLFPRPQQRVLVSQLSGGEKRRLYLLTILMNNPNFLILDEPTNDLDIITLNVLEEYLMEFPGCLIIVTHDRYFMDKLVDHIFVLEGDGNVKDFNGTYSEYRNRKKEEAQQAKFETNTEIQSDESKGKISFEQRKEVAKLEKEIKKLEEKKNEITSKFEDGSLSSEKIIEYSKELDQINALLEDKEAKWFELSELL